MRFITATFLVGMHLAACEFGGKKSPGSETVVTVGGAVINGDMVRLRMETLPETDEPELAAVAQLVLGTLSALVAGEYGEPVSRDGVTAFWKRYQQQFPPQIRELENKVDHQELFRIALVMPEFANSTVHEIFATAESPHRDKVALVTRLLTQAIAKPKEFNLLAEREGLTVDRLWVGPDYVRSVFAPEPLKPEPPLNAEEEAYRKAEAEAAAHLYRQLGATPVGQVYTQAFAPPDQGKR